MSKSVITDALLTGIANAIREKTGGETSLTPAEMITEIESIETGSGGSTTPEELAYLLINKDLVNYTKFPNLVPLVDFGAVGDIPLDYFAKKSTGSATAGFGMSTNVEKIICPNVTSVGSRAMQYNTDAGVSDGTRALREAYFPVCRSFSNYACYSWGFARVLVLGGASTIAAFAFAGFGALLDTKDARLYINASVISINGQAFGSTGFSKVYFTGSGKPGSMASIMFNNSTYISDIYVPWSEGEVADAPWGAVNATIHYNTQSEPPAMPTA